MFACCCCDSDNAGTVELLPVHDMHQPVIQEKQAKAADPAPVPIHYEPMPESRQMAPEHWETAAAQREPEKQAAPVVATVQEEPTEVSCKAYTQENPQSAAECADMGGGGKERWSMMPMWDEEEEQEASEPAPEAQCEAKTPAGDPLKGRPADGEASMVSTNAGSPRGPCQFTVHLKRSSPNEPLGLALTREDTGGELVIKEPSGKAVTEWNTSNPGLAIRGGDRIVSVNGVEGNADVLLATMRGGESLQIVVRRETFITVTTWKNGKLGLQICPDELFVTSVLQGMIWDYNKSAIPSLQILSGDKIVEVNGHRGTNEELIASMASIKDGDPISISFARPPPSNQ